MDKQQSTVLHKGIYKKTVSVTQAVFLITGMTIGAGILGIPYVVSQVGLITGLFYILILGLVMLSLNLLIGKTAMLAGVNLQLAGLAGKYLGPWFKNILALILVLSGSGTLLAYVIGEGQALSALLGGNPLWWSVFFWSVGSFMIWIGLQKIKSVEGILSSVVILIIIFLSWRILPEFKMENLYHFDFKNILLPYGVILFALHGSPAVAEAHALLPGNWRGYRKALIWGTMIPVVVYMFFALATVGVSGLSTTELVTVGLGKQLGGGILLLANLFAILAMSTAFLVLGIAIKETFTWDYRLPSWVANFLVIIIPLALFLAGWRSFFDILDLVGGLFISIEAIIMVLVAYKAGKMHREALGTREKINFWLLALPVLLVFTIMAVYSIVKLF